jgi:hypothetical protein
MDSERDYDYWLRGYTFGKAGTVVVLEGGIPVFAKYVPPLSITFTR